MKPYPFCPGCSHTLVLDAVDRTLQKIGADPKKTVLVSDIGCVGLADKYFNVHTFHGLHGRSFTYACGIKLANPELLVFVVVGDGGCGIGGNHLINAARRNIGIKVLAFNNLNFGMTGGQHSVTTPVSGKTATTPAGSLERPFDLAGLVSAAGGSYVARVKALDKELDEYIAKAFTHEGFAFLDIWEICTGYYMPANDYKKSAMDELFAKCGYKTGAVREEVLPEYARVLHDKKDGGGREKPAVTGPLSFFNHNLAADEHSIMIAGSAGMKILSAAHLLGQAGLMCGLWASEKDDYPVTVQFGHSISYVKFSRTRINYLGVDVPDAVLVLSGDGLKEAGGVIEKLQKSAVVVIDKNLICPRTEANVFKIDFHGLTKTVHATAAVAKYLTVNDTVPLAALKAAVDGIGNEKIRQINLNALIRISS